MGIDIDREHLSLARAGGNGARFACLGRHGADALYRAEQAEQRRHIVGPHVVQRTRARLIEEGRRRMMELVAVTDEPCAAARNAAELAAVEQLADILEPSAEEGVRGAADEQTLFLRERNQLLPLSKGHGKRLFGINVLAGLERREVVLVVRLRRCQVENQINVRVGDQLHAGGIGFRDAVLGSLALRLFQTARRAGSNFDHIVIFF